MYCNFQNELGKNIFFITTIRTKTISTFFFLAYNWLGLLLRKLRMKCFVLCFRQVSHLKRTLHEYEKRSRPGASPMTPMRSQTPLPAASTPSSFKSPTWPSSSPGRPAGHGRGPSVPLSQSQLGTLQSQASVALSQTPPQSQPQAHHNHPRVGQTALQVQSPVILPWFIFRDSYHNFNLSLTRK